MKSLGGRNGWYYMDWGWTLRGWIDWLLGGVGNRRSRAEELESGGELDTWLVERIDGSGDLVLRSQMRMPRMARLGLHVRPFESGSILIQWVEFHPSALTWAYWWAAYPLHRLVFRGMLKAIVNWAARRQEELSHARLNERRSYRRRGRKSFGLEDPRNLAKITPKSMGMTITYIDEPPGAGTFASSTQSWLFVRLKWVTLITDYTPPELFADIQVAGPYKSWRHEHTFEDLGDKTLMRDRVQYELPFGILGSVTHRLVIAGQLKRTFDFRHRKIRKLFALKAEATAANVTTLNPGGRVDDHGENRAGADLRRPRPTSPVSCRQRGRIGGAADRRGRNIDEHQVHRRANRAGGTARAAAELAATRNGRPPREPRRYGGRASASSSPRRCCTGRNAEADPEKFAIDPGIIDALEATRPGTSFARGSRSEGSGRSGGR